MKAPKTAPLKSSRKPASKAVAKKQRGNISTEEIRPLIMAARDAWQFQGSPGSFDDFRAEEVMTAVGRPGLSSCDHDHFCDLMGHFKLAAGRDDEAMEWFLKGGKNSERQLAWAISQILSAHLALAHATPEQIAATTSPRSLKRRLEKFAALKDHPEGPISFDYLVSIVRDKTRRQDLTLGVDLAASLAERCTVPQLVWIRNTLVNRIAEREGSGLTENRNKSQRSDVAKARRSPAEVAPRPGFDSSF
jgi:hypothetical protein